MKGVSFLAVRNFLWSVATGAGALLAAAALTLLYNWRLITPFAADRETIVAGDFWEVHFPLHKFTVEAWQRGGLPLWTTAINGGHPALADSQFGALYPPNLLAALLLGSKAYTPSILIVQSLAHIAWGFAGAYMFFWWLQCRHARFPGSIDGAVDASSSRLSAPSGWTAPFVGASCFAFGGYMTSYPFQDSVILEVAAWLPWALLGIDLAVSIGGGVLVAVAAVPIAMATLAGYPQTLMYVLYACVGLWLWRVATDRSKPALQSLELRFLAIVSMPLGLALAAAALLPTFELAPLSVRAQPGFQFTSNGLAPHELAGLILRGGFGGAAPLYLGVLPIALALVALLDTRRNTASGFWLLELALSLLLAMGGQTFLYDTAYLVVPGFSIFRNPERSALLVSFAVAALAAQGTNVLFSCWSNTDVRQRIRPVLPYVIIGGMALVIVGIAASGWPAQGQGQGWGPAERDAWYWLLVVAGLFITLLILWWRRMLPRVMWSILLSACLLLELFTAHPTYNLRDLPAGGAYVSIPLMDPVFADRDTPFRISTEGLLPADGNEGIIYSLEDIVGSSPLQLQVFADLQQAEQKHALTELQRLALLNVRYVVTKRDFPNDPRFTQLGKEGDIRLYRLSASATLPRAWIVHGATTSAPGEELGTLGKLDFRKTVLLPEAVDLPREGAMQSGELLSYEHYAPSASELRVTLHSEGVVVFSEIWYPGWSATIDGRAASLLRANHTFRALVVPAGDHLITMTYAPGSFANGKRVSEIAAIALLTLVLGSTVWAIVRRSMPAPKPAVPSVLHRANGDGASVSSTK